MFTQFCEVTFKYALRIFDWTASEHPIFLCSYNLKKPSLTRNMSNYRQNRDVKETKIGDILITISRIE